MTRHDCSCLAPETRWGEDGFEETAVGIDRAHGRYGEVSLQRCRSCGRIWLHYLVEYEAFSESGRWYRGVVDQATARRVTPETAVEVLEGLEWYLYGGSYFGGSGRGSGDVLVDL